MMTAADVLDAMQALRERAVPAWLDGGWGVDALLGEQTRVHEDLDLVIALSESDRAAAALAKLGYATTADERPTRMVLQTRDSRQIDLHSVVFDDGGGGIQRLPGGRSYRYPPQGFSGQGSVAGHLLPCLTAEVQLECHTGYEPTDTDRHDVHLLMERFSLSAPKGY